MTNLKDSENLEHTFLANNALRPTVQTTRAGEPRDSSGSHAFPLRLFQCFSYDFRVERKVFKDLYIYIYKEARPVLFLGNDDELASCDFPLGRLNE